MDRAFSIGLAAALCLAGCSRAHERVNDLDAGADAARAVDAARADARDAFVVDAGPPDEGVPDAGACERPGTAGPLHACVLTATGAIPSGEAFSLPLTYARCECAATRSCRVAIADDVISLTTSTCDDPIACDECEFDLGCALPPLSPGHYFVDVDGTRTMEVDAVPRTVPPVGRPICAPTPEPPDVELVCELDARPAPSRPLRVCRPALEDVGRYVRFDVVLPCPSCFDVDAGCETQLDGSRVVLRPHIHRCDCPTCGACDPTCVPLTIACTSPPLSSGSYEVVVETDDGPASAGRLEVRDVLEAGDPVCVDVP